MAPCSISRLLKLSSVWTTLGHALDISPKYFDLFSLVVMQFVYSHFLACLWYSLTAQPAMRSSDRPVEGGRLRRGGINRCLSVVLPHGPASD